MNTDRTKGITEKNYPSVDSDLLMLAASFNRSPSAPEVFCLQNIIGLGLIQEKTGWWKDIICNFIHTETHISTSLSLIPHLSEPARSTRFSLANRRLVVESFSHLLSITQVKTLCERLLSLFIFVAATLLFEEPFVQQITI